MTKDFAEYLHRKLQNDPELKAAVDREMTKMNAEMDKFEELGSQYEQLTWDLLAKKIAAMPEAERQKEVQVVVYGADLDAVHQGLPGFMFNTVDSMDFEGFRSTTNNKYNGEEFVLAVDHAGGFAEDGAIAYEITDGLDDTKPIYGKDGKTDRADQMNPNFDDLIPASEIAMIQSRADKGREE